MPSDYLFSKVDWFSIEESQKRKMQQEIAELDSGRILGSSLNDLCEYFEGKYRVEAPQLDKGGIVADQQEREIDVSGDRDRHWSTPGPHYMKGTELSLTIPFSGDPETFKIRPSSFT